MAVVFVPQGRSGLPPRIQRELVGPEIGAHWRVVAAQTPLPPSPGDLSASATPRRTSPLHRSTAPGQCSPGPALRPPAGLGIQYLIPVACQHVERREHFTVRVQTHIQQIAIKVAPMLPPAGLGDHHAHLVALVRRVPIGQDAVRQGQGRSNVAVPALAGQGPAPARGGGPRRQQSPADGPRGGPTDQHLRGLP